jgi:hypothetical protein
MTYRLLALIAALLLACGDDQPEPTPSGEHVAIVEGTLNDPATARTTHDTGAMAAEPGATTLGDLAHIVGLGASVLGTTPERWTVIDRWADAAGADAFYGDPAFQQGLAALVTAPQITLYRRETAWYGWGDFDAGAGAPRWYAVVRGRFKTVATAQADADAGAMAAEATARALGDAAHVALTGRDDPAQFLAIDVWTRPDMIAAFYSDPKFQVSAQALFDGGLAITVLHATDWYQWGSVGKTSLDGGWKIGELTCAGTAQPLGDFRLDVRAAAGTFVQVFDPGGCVATYDESYAYTAADAFAITANTITCDPSTTCQAVLGADCLPKPPPTDFAWTLANDRLVFTRTAAGPGDLPCQPGDAMKFTMQRTAL